MTPSGRSSKCCAPSPVRSAAARAGQAVTWPRAKALTDDASPATDPMQAAVSVRVAATPGDGTWKRIKKWLTFKNLFVRTRVANKFALNRSVRATCSSALSRVHPSLPVAQTPVELLGLSAGLNYYDVYTCARFVARFAHVGPHLCPTCAPCVPARAGT